jgi:hypothetical protein
MGSRCGTKVDGVTLSELVRAHVGGCLPCDEDLQWFKELPVQEAVRRAALCRTRAGDKEKHQRRIPLATLNALARTLAVVPFAISDGFAGILGRVGAKRIRGIGELTQYDVARRIGAHFGLEPEYVYLHAGTRDGARALGLPHRRPYLEVWELPRALRRLRPWQIEDFLCIHKEKLSAFRGAR